ncbi:MAG: V-type ATP synthase subunit D [Bacilli bacterium]
MASNQYFPTKGNLLALKKSNELAHLGYELMDRKRNILIREMMQHIDEVRIIRQEIARNYRLAYMALQEANISLGIIGDIAKAIPVDQGLEITYRSIMGVEIPIIQYEAKPIQVTYGFGATNSKFDYAFTCFIKARDLTIRLAEVDNTAYRLASAILKAKKRANALKNVVIPNFQINIKYISDALEEKEREEFARNKVIKHRQEEAEEEQ